MDPAALRQRVLNSVAAGQRDLGRYGPQGCVLEGPGFVAAVVPPLDDATLVNGAVILDPEALPDALPQLTAAYDKADVARWGVLFAPDPHAVAALVAAGLRPETQPTAMAADLTSTTTATEHTNHRHALNGLSRVQPTDFATAGRVNDYAYGHPDDRMEILIQDFPAHAARIYSVDYAEETASVALVSDHDQDAAVSFVATLPWAQRLGLATHVLAHALHEARERGAITSTLIASPMGRGLYATLGYQDVGHLELWQYRRRRP